MEVENKLENLLKMICKQFKLRKMEQLEIYDPASVNEY